jgi:competence protein ComEA
MSQIKDRMARLAARGATICARIRASPWIGIGGRALAVAFALIVLAWIGKSAAAGVPVAEPPAATIVPPPTPAVDAAPVASAIADAAAPPVIGASATHARASPTDPVYLNLADEAELRRLPGVGAKRATAILALRQRLGRFSRVEDLLRVKGVGRTTLKKWRALVKLDAVRGSPDGGST